MTSSHAAAVLVLRGPRALGFSKFSLPGVSMPCGKVEPGETPAEAALREGKEETGLDLEIKYETAVYDSNDLHDRWWMEPATNK